MKSFFMVYGLALVVLFVLDFVWLGATSDKLYRPNMVGIVREQFMIPPAVLFYFMYAFGISYLVVWPALFGPAHDTLLGLTIKAAVFGFICYGTYDLTGLAVLKNWSVKLAIVDMAWGTLASVITANVIAFALKMFGQIA